jgi:hypothetical protein
LYPIDGKDGARVALKNSLHDEHWGFSDNCKIKFDETSSGSDKTCKM